MPEVKTRLEAVLTIDGAEITNVKEIDSQPREGRSRCLAHVPTTAGVRTVGTLKDASIEFTVLNKEGDSAFDCFKVLEQWRSL